MAKSKKSKRTFLGMPMNWDTKRPFRALWDQGSDCIWVPKSFGIGWTINFHAVCSRVGLVGVKGTKKRKAG